MRHAPLTTATTAALLGLALGATGCFTDDGSAILILHNQLPGQMCTTQPQESDAFLSRGLIDAQSNRGYLLTPLVKNEALSVDGLADSQRTAFLQGANVSVSLLDDTVDDAALADVSTRFSVPFSAAVAPDEGLSSVRFEVLPVDVLGALGAELGPGEFALVEVAVRLFGELGGGDFEGREFKYPIEVCDGCAVFNAGSCAELPVGFPARAGGNCNALQDPPDLVDCCTDAGGALVCPAVGTATP